MLRKQDSKLGGSKAPRRFFLEGSERTFASHGLSGCCPGFALQFSTLRLVAHKVGEPAREVGLHDLQTQVPSARVQRQVLKIANIPAAEGASAVARQRPVIFIHRGRVVIEDLLSGDNIRNGDQSHVIANSCVWRAGVIDEYPRRLDVHVKSRPDLERITLPRAFGYRLFKVDQRPGKAEDFLAFAKYRTGEDPFTETTIANADLVTHCPL
jgi:hypothetical protein